MYSKDIGGVAWIDLTVDNAGGLRDFYQKVIGFEVDALSMGDYDDYVMKSPSNPDIAVGVCHARGPNADLPPQWLIYFNVDNIDQSIDHCLSSGGQLIRDKMEMGDSYMCVIKDPSGAPVALIAKK